MKIKDKESIIVYMGNNAHSDVLGEWKYKLLPIVNGSKVILSDVLYVPDVHRNLILVSALDKKEYEIWMKSSIVTITKGHVN